jgi:hypothetical protein
MNEPVAGLPAARLGRLAIGAALVVILLGGVGLLGWILDSASLKSIGPGLATMKVNTALALLLSGAALLLSRLSSRAARLAGACCAGVVTLIGLLTIAEHLGLRLGIDELLFRDLATAPPAIPGRMAAAGALSFALAGMALLHIHLGSPKQAAVSQLLALATVGLALLALSGYTYDVAALYHVQSFTSMALHTAFALLVLGLGILCARPERGLMIAVSRGGIGAGMVRRLLPLAVGVPLVLGWLTLTGHRLGFYDPAFGTALFTVATTVALTALIGWESGHLQRLDDARRSAEEELRTSERSFRLLFADHPFPMWVYDLETLGFLDVNEATVARYGYSREEFLALRLTDIRPREDVPRLLADVRHERPPLQASGEWRHRLKSGRLIDVRIVSHLLPFAGRRAALVVAEDITERKRAEVALRASEARFRTLVESIAELVALLDGDRRVRYASPAARRILDHEPHELCGRSLLDLVHPEDREAAEAVLAGIQESGGAGTFSDFRVRRRDGTWRWIEGTARNLLDEPGVEAIAGTFRDVTERRRIEDEIRALNAELEDRVRERTAQLEAANRELEAFSYSVSHDLRAPLRAIDGFSLALLEDCADRLDHAGQDFLERIRRATGRMAALIDDFLKLSRLARGDVRREPVDLGALAEEVARDLRARDPEREVRLVIGGDLVAEADATLVRVVIENLLGNAWKFTARRGEAVIELGAEDRNGERVFYVRDNGAGFDMAYAGKLFVPFQRLHGPQDFHGTGVGLATVQRIVHRHGGRIWAEAVVDGGAAFFFTL